VVPISGSLIEKNVRADFIYGMVQIIAKIILDILFYCCLLLAVVSQEEAAATDCAPFIPSGWLWVTSALRLASFKTSAMVGKANPTGLTLMAEPFPKLPYGLLSLLPNPFAESNAIAGIWIFIPYSLKVAAYSFYAGGNLLRATVNIVSSV